MAITLEEFCRNYPTLYHMAEANSWPSILKHGLLSTTALLDLYSITGEQRLAIESCHRPISIIISHPSHGSAVIRDQRPMRESALAKCLQDCSAKEWFELLNRKVFFWVTEERVRTLLRARAYRGREHLVISVNTALLLQRHQRLASLSPINSGSTIYRPVPRGIATFRPFNRYPYEHRRRTRGIAGAIAEIAFEYSVPDVGTFVRRVERRQGNRIREVIFSL